MHTTPEQNIFGNDIIEVNAKEIDKGKIYGGLGDDEITINADLKEVEYVGAEGTTISGDEENLTSGRGGNDTITINGTMSAGNVIAGDASTMSGTAKGEHDKINITSVINDTISGDGYEMYDEAQGGKDKIIIADLYGGSVGGDAGGIMQDSTKGGDDEIHITNLNGGIVTGDAGESMQTKGDGTILGGNDLIIVDNFTKGAIYGDAKEMSGNVTAGSDTIIIKNLVGNEEKLIYGDAETMNGIKSSNNTFKYDNDHGDKITLNDDGNVKIFDADGNNITDATNTTIKGFSGIGGSGNDTLEGNSSNNILVDGAGDDLLIASFGNDTMTGGSGKDTFQWNKSFNYQMGTTTITDFTVGEDKLRIEDLLDDGGNLGDLTKLTVIFKDNILTLSMEGADFAKSSLEGPVTVAGTEYASSAAFYEAYQDSSNQEAMMTALLQSMLG